MKPLAGSLDWRWRQQCSDLSAKAGKHLDLFSVHVHRTPNFQEHHAPDYFACMMLSENPDAHMSAVIESIDKSGMRGRIKVACDEWNLRSWHHPGFSGHQAREVDHQGPAVMALIKASDKSLDPALYSMVMYANLLQAHVARTRIESGRLTHDGTSVALVDAIATADDSGATWTVAMMNRHLSEQVLGTLVVGELPLDGTYKATILTGDAPDADNDIEHPHRVAPREVELTFEQGAISLLPHSLCIVAVLLKK